MLRCLTEYFYIVLPSLNLKEKYDEGLQNKVESEGGKWEFNYASKNTLCQT